MRRDLKSLISIIEDDFEAKGKYYKRVVDHDMFVSSLKELEETIGNKRLKQETAATILHALSRPEKRDGAMLNCILCGPPGVGKTMVGKVLAKIWFSLGYLKGAKKACRNNDSEEDTGDLVKFDYSWLFLIAVILVIWLILEIGFLIAKRMGDYFSSRRDAVIFCVAILVGWVLGIYIVLSVASTVKVNPEALKKIHNQEDKETKPNSGQFMKVVTREDFIGEYLGQTGMKTRALLQRSLGGVLFVDEAYNLCSDRRDSYGIQALTTLNEFMSSHPDEIIVIFAGYEKPIRQNLFSVQEGLVRRFPKTFHCDPYNPSELADILLLQAKHLELRIKDEDYLRSLVRENYEEFHGFGGSTKNLLDLSSVENSNDVVYEDAESGLITNRQLDRALDAMIANRPIEEESNGIQALLDRL